MKLLKGKLSILLLSTLLSVSSMASDTGYDAIIRSANQGNAQAQLALGYMYDLGKGVPQDKHKAFEWYQKAANQGDAKSQAMMAMMYYKGEGVQQDKYKSKEWAGKACDNGYQLGCDAYKGFNELGF